MKNKISIGIVTYNNRDIVDNVLMSIKHSSVFDDISCYIIDNNSSDNIIEYLRNHYYWVTSKKLDSNIGYGKAHNIIINSIDSEYHLILNPDVTFDADVLYQLANYMNANKDVCMVQPLILSPDGTIQELPHKHPKLKFIIGRFFQNSFNWAKKLNREYVMNKNADYPYDIEVCSGSFMFCRTEVLRAVGGFDKRYFMYFEDADLSRSVGRLGRIVLNPSITITHEWKRDNKKTFRGVLRYISSMVKYFLKWTFVR